MPDRKCTTSIALGALVALALTVRLADAQGPVKIGFLSPLSGAIAQAGKDMYSGCELFWEESGWQLAGRKLEVILEDNEGVPATTLTKARKLVESDRVNMLAGVILSNVAYALVPYVEAQGIPTIYPINSADDLTQRKRPKWLIRTGFSASGNMHPVRGVRGQDARLQEGRHRLARLRLRLGDGGRLPQDLRGQRRPDHPADLGAAQRAGLRAVPGPDPPGRRRRVRAGARTLDRALRQAVGGQRAQDAAHRRRHLHRRARAARSSATSRSA